MKLDRQWAFAGVTLIELAAAEQLSSTRDGSVQARRMPGLLEDKKTDRLKNKKIQKKRQQVKRKKTKEMESSLHKLKYVCKQ